AWCRPLGLPAARSVDRQLTRIFDQTPLSADLHFHGRRSAVGRNVLAVITVLVVVMAVMAALSRGSQFTTSSTSPSSPAGGNTATQKTPYAGLNITYMFVDVLSGSFRPPSSNTTTINKDKTTYTASVGATFTVEVDIE